MAVQPLDMNQILQNMPSLVPDSTPPTTLTNTMASATGQASNQQGGNYNVAMPSYTLGTDAPSIQAAGPLQSIINQSQGGWMNLMTTPNLSSGNFITSGNQSLLGQMIPGITAEMLGQNLDLGKLAEMSFTNPQATQLSAIGGVSGGGGGYLDSLDKNALLNPILQGQTFFNDPRNYQMLYEAMGATPWLQTAGPQGDAFNFLMGDVLSPDSNPYLREYMDLATANMQEDFARNVLPMIQDRFSQAGQTGSSRHGVAEGIALGDLAREIATARAQMASTGYGQGLEALQRGLGIGSDDYQGTLGRRLEALGLGSEAEDRAMQRRTDLLDVANRGYEAAQQRQLQASTASMQGQLAAQSNELAAMGYDIDRQRMLLDAIGGAQGNVRDLLQLGLNAEQLGLNYDIQDRNQMLNNLQFAPQLAGLGLLPAEIMNQYGQQGQDQVQNQINDALARWMFYQNLPQEQLAQYAALLNGVPSGGNSTATTIPTQAGGLSGILGGLLGGAQAGGDLASILGPIFSGGGGAQQTWEW